MKVILDKQNRKTGIFIPLEEWDEVISTVHANSALYQILAQNPPRSVFEMNAGEIAGMLQPVTSKLVNEALDAGLYTSHAVNETGIERQFLHRYADGHIELIEVDPATGSEYILKEYR